MKGEIKFRDTFIISNERIKTERLDYEDYYVNVLNSLLDDKICSDELNIKVKSIRRASFGFAFVDFESTNDKSIKQNIKEYLNDDLLLEEDEGYEEEKKRMKTYGELSDDIEYITRMKNLILEQLDEAILNDFY